MGLLLYYNQSPSSVSCYSDVPLVLHLTVLTPHCSYIMDRQHGRGAVCLHKEWAPLPSPFPCSTLVLDIAAFAPEFRENITSLEELFPPKCQCFIMSTPHYGSLAEVCVLGGYLLHAYNIIVCVTYYQRVL